MPGAGRQACRFKVTAFVAVRQHNLPNRQSVAQAPHRFRVARCPSTGLAVRRCFLSGADIASYPGLGQSRAAAPLPRPARTEPEWCFCDGPTTAQIQAAPCFWPGHRLEAWQVMPPIGAVEPLAWIDCSGKEAAGSRAVRYETDTQLFERWKYPRLWFPPPHGILTLHRSHREYRMCAANCPGTRFRQSPVFQPYWINAFTVSATSSIGTFGSGRC